MELISTYRITIPAQTPRGQAVRLDQVLCAGCASRETLPLSLVRPEPQRQCVRCGFDAYTARALRVADILDQLVDVVELARLQVADQLGWMDDLNDAYDWLLQYDGEIVTDGHIVLLPSESQPGIIYSVNGQCQCGSFAWRATARKDRACKHRVRAKLIKLALAARDLAALPPVVVPPADIIRPRPTLAA
jgi:hypothetical protein